MAVHPVLVKKTTAQTLENGFVLRKHRGLHFVLISPLQRDWKVPIGAGFYKNWGMRINNILRETLRNNLKPSGSVRLGSSAGYFTKRELWDFSGAIRCILLCWMRRLFPKDWRGLCFVLISFLWRDQKYLDRCWFLQQVRNENKQHTLRNSVNQK